MTALAGTTAICAFSSFALGSQAVADVGELRDDQAVWNVARPVIEEAIANLAVSSLATMLLIVLFAGTTALWWRVREPAPRRSPAIVVAIILALALAGVVVWLSGAKDAGGLSVLVTDIGSGDALPVFENYDAHLDGWSAEATGLLFLSVAAVATTFVCVTCCRRRVS